MKQENLSRIIVSKSLKNRIFHLLNTKLSVEKMKHAGFTKIGEEKLMFKVL